MAEEKPSSLGDSLSPDQEQQVTPYQSEDDLDEEEEYEGETIVLQPGETDVDATHAGLKSLEVFKELTQLETLCVRRNMITAIEDNLDKCGGTLRELDLYDNKIVAVEGLTQLTNLEVLDYSYNRIRVVDNVAHLVKLRKLFLVNNKITQVPANLPPSLTMLELGSNRLRKLENLDHLPALDQLYVGRNKITKLDHLSQLTNLTLLSIQSNRLIKIEGLSALVNLEQLYLSNNGIERLEGLDNNVKLKTLDVACNRISRLENISHLVELEEFWCNDNQIDNWQDLDALKHAPRLETVYLDRNPISRDTAYRRKVKLALPTLKQIDVTLC